MNMKFNFGAWKFIIRKYSAGMRRNTAFLCNNRHASAVNSFAIKIVMAKVTAHSWTHRTKAEGEDTEWCHDCPYSIHTYTLHTVLLLSVYGKNERWMRIQKKRYWNCEDAKRTEYTLHIHIFLYVNWMRSKTELAAAKAQTRKKQKWI